MFKTTLKNAFESASVIVLGGYEVDDDMWRYEGGPSIEVDFTEYESATYSFDAAQEIEIDANGETLVKDIAGLVHEIYFGVLHPLAEKDLLK